MHVYTQTRTLCLILIYQNARHALTREKERERNVVDSINVCILIPTAWTKNNRKYGKNKYKITDKRVEHGVPEITSHFNV